MNDARLAELREKYKNRNLLEELAWGIYADHSGYTPKQSGEFLNWLCNMAYRAVKGQQKAWIPVSKRLPEEAADVICCTDAEEVFIASYLGKLDDGSECFDDDNGMMCEGDVVAWMPLPEPYKADMRGGE